MVNLSKRWAIVLAGGEGERLRPAVKSWFGSFRPKQYCTFVGTRCMFQHTVDRAQRLVQDQILTVIARGHEKFLKELSHIPGKVLVQPNQKDTGVGIMFPLTCLMAKDPDASVAVFPSDHFIWPEERFLSTVRHVLSLVDQNPTSLILLVARPDCAETDYGWVRTTKRHRDHPQLRRIRTFLEKPSRQKAEEYYASGCFWNTMIMVGKARCFWELGRSHMPEVTSRFDLLRRVLLFSERGRIDPRQAEETLEFIYGKLQPVNFSTRLLSKAHRRCLAFPLEGIEWSDWGRPERIRQSLARFGTAALSDSPLASAV